MIPALGLGGGARATLGCARLTAERGFSSRVVSLGPVAERMRKAAQAQGTPLIEVPGRAELRGELERAAIVHVHFWNSPELYEVLRDQLPSMRLVIWTHVGGAHPPQVIVPELAELADVIVAASALSLRLDSLRGHEVELIPPVGDPERGRGIERVAHEGFTVGYIGTVDPIKMHPEFVELSSRVQVAGARFVVCGSGGGFKRIADEATELGTRERFDLRGFVEDVDAVLAELDVFGYPLCEDNYSAGELILQEAMRAGIPPVVLSYGGAGAMVEDGKTGVVAGDEDEYVRALELLARDVALRRRLGEAAREHAERTWSAESIADRWSELYSGMLSAPKRERSWPGPLTESPAELFLAGVGDREPEFRASLEATDPESALAADREIEHVSPAIVNGEGGLLDYRRRYPQDPYLRLWSGLVLGAAGRPALAAGELSAAARLGCEAARVAPHLDPLVAR